VAAILATPAAWSASVLHPDHRGSAFDASAGPVPKRFDVGDLGRTGSQAGPFTPVEAVDRLAPDRRRVVEYLVARRDGARYVAAVDGGFSGGPLMAATGLPFLPMGGFNTGAPHPTVAHVQHLVATGELRFLTVERFWVEEARAGTSGATAAGLPAVLAWAVTACTDVTAEALGTEPVESFSPLAVLRCG
jgi:hypothetical protein